ncbi:hypothetical protein O6H91_22G025000 [Diphasiastrum complanatum]|uniref:Uncharacterized protein n=1 Tax=Diphasiastrum complanatum TaxID=34168 RepID=A0ACC2AE38_DIPCM|nr:hypothetical protein O6H91_22G025000 [Diphasiastrum complanatum]
MTASCQIDEDTEAKVLRQVEFYFSDSNLPRDRFLLRSIEESEDGLVSLALVSSFSRMRNHLGLKESGADKVPPEVVSAVADILRKSSLLSVSDDGLKVGRATKLLKPEEVRAEVEARSIAASPLPWNITMDQVESFFSQFAKVSSVRLHRHQGLKVFSGVAVIEFSSEEEVQKVLEMKLVFEGTELELQHKKEFNETVQSDFPIAKDIQQSNTEEKSPTGNHRNERMNAEHREDFPRGVVVSFKLEKIQRTGNSLDERDGDAVSADEKSAELSKEVSMTEDILAREDIKDVLGKYGTIMFVDFSRGDTSGYVRFELPDAAQKARAAAVLASEGGLVIKTFLVNLEAVEAEEAYWKKVWSCGGRGHGGRGYGGRGYGGRGFDNRRRGRGRYGFGGRKGRGRGRGRGDSGSEEQVGDDVQSKTQGKHTRFEEDDESGVPSKISRKD